MSETVAEFGKLKRIPTIGNFELTCVNELKKYNEMWDDANQDVFEDVFECLQEYSGYDTYLRRGDNLYEITDVTRIDDGCHITETADGYEFAATYYNGGASLNEVIVWEMDEKGLK